MPARGIRFVAECGKGADGEEELGDSQEPSRLYPLGLAFFYRSPRMRSAAATRAIAMLKAAVRIRTLRSFITSRTAL